MWTANGPSLCVPPPHFPWWMSIRYYLKHFQRKEWFVPSPPLSPAPSVCVLLSLTPLETSRNIIHPEDLREEPAAGWLGVNNKKTADACLFITRPPTGQLAGKIWGSAAACDAEMDPSGNKERVTFKDVKQEPICVCVCFRNQHTADLRISWWWWCSVFQLDTMISNF